MSREYSDFANDDVKHWLKVIADKSTSPKPYKDAMTALGRHLGMAMATKISTQLQVYLVSTVEDADFLALGALQKLESQIDSVGFACFWNERTSLFDRKELAVAPVLKQYREPADQVDTLIVMKSIISSGCVVRTNLQNLIQQMQPKCIFIAAPVVYYQAEGTLREAFGADITNKFQFFYFAKDHERNELGEVLPGIGGMVYTRLGFDGQADKNRYLPAIVKQRRQNIIERRKASV
ncbi:MAG: hypothetical protein ACFB0E_15190 [Leptolyngbyaceae cyanobacterium]